MTTYELVELLEQLTQGSPRIRTAVRIADDQLAVEDQHGERHFITVEEV